MSEKWGVRGTRADGRTRWAMSGRSVWTSNQKRAELEAETLNRYAVDETLSTVDLYGWVWTAERVAR